MQLFESVHKAGFLLSGSGIYSIPHKQVLETTVTLYGKPLKVSLSRKALAQLKSESELIEAEVELYFSCLIRKRVLFHTLYETTKIDESRQQVVPGFWLRFNAVTTKVCSVAENPNEPLKEAMPIVKPGRFVPDWVTIDYRSGQWMGEYSYNTNRY